MFFFCAHSFAAVKGAPAQAFEGIFATFGSSPVSNPDVFKEVEETHTMSFRFVGPEVARKLGLTKSQMDSYNKDLDQLNSMMNEVSHELAGMNHPTVEDAVSMWAGLKGAVSRHTLEALRKLTKGK